MKKLLLILSILIASYAGAQTIPHGSCGLLYTYDNGGNRTKHEYYCNNSGGPVQMKVVRNEKAANNETSIQKIEVLFPNPTTGRFTIRFADELKNVPIIITDAHGRAIQQLTGNGYLQEFDLSGQPSGTYFVTVRDPKGEIVQKVVKR